MSGLIINQKRIAEICRNNQIDFVGVFGSVARGEMRPMSDIDLLVRFSPNSKGGYFKLVDVEEEFSRELGRKVDLVTQGSLSKYIKDRVYNDLQIVYGQP